MTQHYNLDWLRQQVDNKVAIDWNFFWKPTPDPLPAMTAVCFSQWYPSTFIVNNHTYFTTEHWMMAHKALLFGDELSFELILQSESPAIARSLGRTVKGYSDEAWDQYKFDIVKVGNIHKFHQHPVLKDYLMGTGFQVLVEASPMDAIWGTGHGAEHAAARNPHHWRGLNLLGFALMEVRDYFQEYPSLDINVLPQFPWWKHEAL